MARTSIRSRADKRKLAAAAIAVRNARATIISARRGYLAPPRTGGFYGLWNGRRGNELKFIDPATLGTNVGILGQVNLLNGVIAGTDYNQRIGRKTLIKSLLIRYTINPVASTVNPNGDVVRVLVVYDNQTNGALPAVTDILQSAFFQAPMNLNNRDRFKVLYDKFHPMAAFAYTTGALTSGSPITKNVTKFKKCSLDCIFSGTTAAVGSIATGGIYVLTISMTNAVSNINFDCRIRFIDS